MNYFKVSLFLATIVVVGSMSACTPSAVRPLSASTNGFVITDDGVRLYYVEKGSGPNVLVAPLALYLETIREALLVEKMALLGWSSLGMEMAVYTLRHPDRVTRLIQLSSLPPAAFILRENGSARTEVVDRTALEALDQRASAGDFDEMPEEYCRLRYAITVPAEFVDAEFAKTVPDICIHENEWRKNIRPYFGALFTSIGDYDWRDDLRTSIVPRLVIHGREDRIPFAGAEAWVAGYPNARLLPLSPSGHFSFIEQKEAVIDAVETFLDGDWPRDAVSVSAEVDRHTSC